MTTDTPYYLAQSILDRLAISLQDERVPLDTHANVAVGWGLLALTDAVEELRETIRQGQAV